VERGTPFLSSIPLLGWLFRTERTETTRTELLLATQAWVQRSPDERVAESLARRLAFERSLSRTAGLEGAGDAGWAVLVASAGSEREADEGLVAEANELLDEDLPPSIRLGFILTIAADVAAMAPGTHIGAAHPVAGNGEKMDETMAKKAAEDIAAYVRTLATTRQRNVTLAEQAVNESRAFTEGEARAASPPLVDLIASDVTDLLHQLDGRSVRRFDGKEVVLKTAGAQVVPVAMNLRQRILSTIANPNIAYLLMSLGMLGLTIELWSPGAILPGVVGGVSLLLAFFALQLLPVNYAGVLLILLGLLLLVLEIKVTSFGLLTVGGLASLIFGSMILMDSSLPELQLNLWYVLPVVMGFGGIAMLLVRLGVKALRQPAATGEVDMLDRIGQALTALGPDEPGRVAVRGEIWQATAAEAIPEGAAVRIVKVDGLTLTVRKK